MFEPIRWYLTNIAPVPIPGKVSMDYCVLEIRCGACGRPHQFALDISGHYSGRLPCNHRKISIQVDPQQWRQLYEQEQEKTIH